MVGTQMYSKIQKLKHMGYKKQQAARELGVDNKTVGKYWSMTEHEFANYLLQSKARSRCMEPYRAVVLDKLTQHRAITSAIIYDQLREFHPDFKPSYRSVRRFVADLREQEGLPTSHQIRQYAEVCETPLGFQAQVDMGVKTMQDCYGKSIKIYIFSMVLSSSRYKFMCFQTKPFTAETFCRAHDEAFRYFGGRPDEIVYDQDRVMVVSENAGDILFTQVFENYKNYAGFSVLLCRGFDPESKGKIEAVIKYIKGNFLAYRTFYSLSQLGSDGLKWLDRTGNGQIHNTTKIIPAVAFVEEQKHLKSAPELGETNQLPRFSMVRKDNVVMYKQNRYSMPKGTYWPSRRVRIEEDGTTIRFYDEKTDALIEQLPLAKGVGQSVRNSHPERQRNGHIDALKTKVLEGFSQNPLAVNYVAKILENKPRYARDQLSLLLKLQQKYAKADLVQAVEYCYQRELFSAATFGESLAYLAMEYTPKSTISQGLPAKYGVVTTEKRDISIYENPPQNRGDLL